jgi:actin-related protein
MIPPARASWSDVDIRKGLYSNDVLSDGIAVVAGIGERIMEELTALAIAHDEE